MVQVQKSHYFLHNLKPEKFQLYYHIIKTVLGLDVHNVLEIGIGQGIVSHVLKFNLVDVTTADFDSSLSPDIVCDVRNIPCKKEIFDLVLISEVLEHIPYSDLEDALLNISQLIRKYAVISVPYNQHCLNLYTNLKINKYLYFSGWLNRFIERKFPLYFYFGLPQKNRKYEYDGEHYWEIGYREYPLKEIRNVFGKYFKIEKELRVPLSPYHYIFILKKR